MSIATKLDRLNTIKQDIKSALEEKGQTPSNNFTTYADEIRNIQVGGDETLTSLDNWLVGNTGYLEITGNATSIKEGCFNSTGLNKLVRTVNLPKCLIINANAFYGSTNLTDINFSSCEKVRSYSFNNCSKLINVNLPSCKIVEYRSFDNVSSIEKYVFDNLEGIDGNYAFANNSQLKVFVIKTSKVCNLNSVSVFNGCYKLLGVTNSTYNPNGENGYFYVPDDLLNSYKSATNWSSLADRIKPLSEYVEE